MKTEIVLLITLVLFISETRVDGQKIQCVEEPIPTPKQNIVGAPTYVKVDDTIREIGLNSSHQWNQKQIVSENFFKVVCIKSAQKQVVSGILYRLNVTLAESKCRKSELLNKAQSYRKLLQSHVDECAVKADGGVLSCEFAYLSQPWLNRQELTDIKCVNNVDQFYTSLTRTESKTSISSSNAMSVIKTSFYTLVLSMSSIFLALSF